MERTKGITANIYRSDYNSCMNRLEKFNRVVVIDKELDEVFSPSDDTPAVKLIRRTFSTRGEYIHAEPMEPGNYMFGGSFIFTSDSRLREVNAYPIPLHDRQETFTL